MKKLSLYVFLVLMWCNVGFTFDLRSSQHLQKILGKDVKPHIIFRCEDVKDANKQKTIGLTPVRLQDEDVIYYVVSNTKAEGDGGESFIGGESLLFPTDKNHNGANVWFKVFKHNDYTGLWYYYLGGSPSLHKITQEWLTVGIIALNPINDDKIPQKSKKVFDSKKINKLIDELNSIYKSISIISVSPTIQSGDPIKYLKIIAKENKRLYSIADEIVEILDEKVDGSGGEEYWENKELCKKIK